MADDDANGTARKLGRPIGKRGTFTFRVTPALRAKLEAAAKANEGPVSEEIEKRLEQSFLIHDVIAQSSQTAASVAINAAIDFFKGVSGGEKYYNFGVGMASALQVAMYAQDMSNIDISDIHLHSEKRRLIEDYMLKCMAQDFEGKNIFAPSVDNYRTGIQFNLQNSDSRPSDQKKKNNS